MAASRSRSVGIVTAGALLQMVVQFLLQLILAREFGAASDMDAFVAAATIPLVIGGMIGVPLGAVLIPSLSRVQAESGDDAATELAGQSGVLSLGVTVLIAAVVAWQARAFAQLFFSEADTRLTAKLLAIVAWLIPANTLTTFCQSLQNWRGRFFQPALAGVLGPLVTVALVVVMVPRMGVVAVAYGMVAGAVANVLVQWPGVGRLRWKSTSLFRLRRPLALMGPLLLGSIYLRIEPLVDRSLAAGVGVGAISHLGYASRLTNAVLVLTSGALSVVAFPYFAAAAAKGRSELAAEVSQTLGVLVFLVTPFFAAFALFAPDMVHDLFQRGEFASADTIIVALLVRGSLGVLIGAGIAEILARAYYADHDVWTPTIIGFVTLTLAIAAKVALVEAFGVIALVLTSSAAFCLNAAAQLAFLRRRLGAPVLTGVPQAFASSLLAAALACLAGGLALRLPFPVPAVWGGLAGAVAYAVTAVLLPGRFSTRILEIYRARFGRTE